MNPLICLHIGYLNRLFFRYMDGKGSGTIVPNEEIDSSYISDDDNNNYDNDDNDVNYDDNRSSSSNNNKNDNDNNDNDDIDHNNKSDKRINGNKNENMTSRKPKTAPSLQEKYCKMTEGLCDVLSDFGLVSFLPLNIQDGEVRNVYKRHWGKGDEREGEAKRDKKRAEVRRNEQRRGEEKRREKKSGEEK